MKTEKWFCDKCKKETEQRKLRAVVIGHRDYSMNFGSLAHSIDMELCPECQEKLGLIKTFQEKEKGKNASESLKGRLYDIMAELIHETGVSREWQE